jgi:hypothetical protein
MYNTSIPVSWVCLACGIVAEAQPTPTDDNDLVAMPLTAGQREERWCRTCANTRVHELQARARGQLHEERASHGPAPGQAFATGAVPPPSAPVQAQALPPQATVNVSEMTDTALEALAVAVQKEQQARRTCVVCTEAPKAVIFYPCKHQCCCQACAARVKECPMCRAVVQDRIVAFQ